MAILAAVVESGSIRRAARELGLTPSAVSQQVRRLEQEVGATLLRRSTRRLDLTEAGDAFHEGCAAMVEAARTAQERLAAVLEAPTGELSLGVPAGFAAAHLVPALAPLLRGHSRLRIRLLITDEKIDLLRERLDLAITIGQSLPSSSLVRHHLADWDLGLYASPEYLAKRGTPAEPRALARHDFIALPRWHHGGDVLVGPDGRRHRVLVAPRVVSNNQLSILQLTVAGFGLSFHVLPEVAHHLASGQLVRVLPAWRLPTLSVDALMPARPRPSTKVRLAIQALGDYLKRLAAAAEPRRRRVSRGR
jgi:LysR family transcriptional regulator, transcriptional activator for aaeXAB operon